ncbi:Ohr family peroxiredoxin [Abyssicoccus albus]|uniref:Ohr subfamily peroxiredoxin n=1 Tax=Abyssicoccus albus TaxID=1817405 RepID=A0A3N5BBQ5_9BACL|nr:Ohr family peroxiredoxin [Abyssicoccus albus]RPF55206.1 Ohr subfamily peroxiredoxin [Abyssicoccus albus]
MAKELFSTEMINTGGREGKVVSPSGKSEFTIKKPGGSDSESGTNTNPEQLFAAGYASCFNGALQLMLSNDNVEFNECKTSANVSLNDYAEGDDKDLRIAVTLKSEIDSLDEAKTKEYMEKAHAFCPYSKAIDGNVDVELTV